MRASNGRMSWGNAAITLAVCAALMTVLLGASELTFRRGARVREAERTVLLSLSGVAQATTLGMVGLLLAFALSMAESRFSRRRHLIVDEANAIGTAYLRADFLDPQVASEVRGRFVRYVDARLAFYDAGLDPDRQRDAEARTERLQREIWTRTAMQANAHPLAHPVSLYVAAVNEAIDRSGDRRAAADDHIPPTFLAVLMFAAIIACAATGYSCGLQHRHFALSAIMVPILLAIGITSVVDLDAGRVGMIRTGQGAMLRLRDSLAAQSR